MATEETSGFSVAPSLLNAPIQYVPGSSPQKHVVVVGAGYVGVASAYFLSKSGHKVTCIESGPDVATATSRRNGYLITPSLTYPWANFSCLKFLASSMIQGDSTVRVQWKGISDGGFRLLPFAWSFLKACRPSNVLRNFEASYQLATYSHGVLNSIVPPSDYASNCSGTLQIFANEKVRDERFAIQSPLKRLGCHFLSLSYQDTLQAEPMLAPSIPVGGASIQCSTDSNGDIALAAKAMRVLCESAGVEFKFNTQVNKLLMTESGERINAVATSTGEIVRADDFVIATGNALNLADQAGDRILQQPMKGYLFTIPVREGQALINHTVVDDHRHIYCSPIPATESEPAKIRISCAVDLVGNDPRPDPKRAEQLLSLASGFFPPGYLDLDRVHISAGLRPQTSDDLPVIGRSPRLSNLWYNVGHGHLGLTRGAGSAALLADLYCGLPGKVDATPFSPARFAPWYHKLPVWVENAVPLFA